MNKILIGSTAIKHYFPDFKRIPNDTDYVVKDKNLFKNENNTEYLENPILFKYDSHISGILKPDYLYTLKISHIFWKLNNNSWDKHMYDIQWLKEKDCVLILNLFEELYKYWGKIHGVNKRSNLDMRSDDFFNNALKYPVNHDYLHELLITHDYFQSQSYPTYKYILKDGAEVDVSEEKWKLLNDTQKYNLVFEEICVMALERNFHSHYRVNYKIMLDKFIRNHAPIWEALWIIENYKKCLKPAFNYIEFLNKKIKNG